MAYINGITSVGDLRSYFCTISMVCEKAFFKMRSNFQGVCWTFQKRFKIHWFIWLKIVNWKSQKVYYI